MSLIDKQEITEVLYRYARAVDRKDFDRVADCYFPDAIDNHGGYIGTVAGLIEDMKSRHATIDSSLHYVTNVLIDLDGDTADVESYCLCYLRQAPAVAGGPQSGPPSSAATSTGSSGATGSGASRTASSCSTSP